MNKEREIVVSRRATKVDIGSSNGVVKDAPWLASKNKLILSHSELPLDVRILVVRIKGERTDSPVILVKKHVADVCRRSGTREDSTKPRNCDTIAQSLCRSDEKFLIAQL